jgi:S1-C subfamily serine protease
MRVCAPLFGAILLFVLHGTTTLVGADWATIVKDMSTRIPRLEMQAEGQDQAGVCSAVVYRVDADKKALALTAAHCVTHEQAKHFDLTVNRRHADVVLYNNLLDLAVVSFKANKEVAMLRAPESPAMGTAVAILGYAFGIEEMAAQFGHVAQSANKETKAIWINADLIFGDSGGAVIDDQGRLVGINSRIYSARGVAHMGAAVSIEDVEDFIDAADRALAKQNKP